MNRWSTITVSTRTEEDRDIGKSGHRKIEIKKTCAAYSTVSSAGCRFPDFPISRSPDVPIFPHCFGSVPGAGGGVCGGAGAADPVAFLTLATKDSAFCGVATAPVRIVLKGTRRP